MPKQDRIYTPVKDGVKDELILRSKKDNRSMAYIAGEVFELGLYHYRLNNGVIDKVKKK